MARIKNDLEQNREFLEGQLGRLGNARAYLHLVCERVDVAARLGQAEILEPALEDLACVDRLITSVQGQLTGSSRPAPRARALRVSSQ